MTTRAELRGAIRRRLEDTGGAPLWDDATLNDLIADAVRRYGQRRPAERSLVVAVSDGARTVNVTPFTPGSRVVRLLDADGGVVPREQALLSDGAALCQGWRWWNGQLLLSLPASAGSWRIDLLDRRAVPTDDVTALDLESGDEEIMILLSVAAALRRRAVEDAKRGNSRGATALLQAADGFDKDAAAGFADSRRRIAAGWLMKG